MGGRRTVLSWQRGLRDGLRHARGTAPHLGRAAQGVGLKVVVLSHQGDSDTRLEGFALGVVDYWTKDLSLAELSARIESVLGSPSPATESAVND